MVVRDKPPTEQRARRTLARTGAKAPTADGRVERCRHAAAPMWPPDQLGWQLTLIAMAVDIDRPIREQIGNVGLNPMDDLPCGCSIDRAASFA